MVLSTSLNDIARFVAKGHSQSAANCRKIFEALQRTQQERNALREAYDNLRLEYNLLRQKTGKSEYMVW